MGWETRRAGRRYFYRKQRGRDGRVRSIYAGRADGQGGLVAALVEADASERATQQATRARALAAHQAAECSAAALARQVEDLAALLLLSQGYYRHKRTWRKRREESMGRSLSQIAQAALDEQQRRKILRAALPELPEAGDFSPQARRAIVARCDAYPDAADRQALRALIAHDPSLVKLGDAMQAALRDAIMPTGAIQRVTTLEYLSAWLDQRRAALGYDPERPLETTLVDHVLLCEVRLSQVEMGYTEAIVKGDGDQFTLSDRALTRAQTRYLRAVETLARLRRVRVEAWASAGADGSRVAGLAVEA